MTYEEVIREAELEFGYSRDMHADPKRQDEVLSLIVKSLKKQIVVQSTLFSYEDHKGVQKSQKCPTCGCGGIPLWDGYCGQCGQAIEWREQ